MTSTAICSNKLSRKSIVSHIDNFFQIFSDVICYRMLATQIVHHHLEKSNTTYRNHALDQYLEVRDVFCSALEFF